MNTFSLKIAWVDDTVGLSEDSIDGRIAHENPHLSTVSKQQQQRPTT